MCEVLVRIENKGRQEGLQEGELKGKQETATAGTKKKMLRRIENKFCGGLDKLANLEYNKIS